MDNNHPDSLTQNTLRLPAEWERVGAVLLAWPHKDTDWAYMLDEVNACYVRLCEELSKRTNLIIATPDHTALMPLVLMSEIVPERLQWFTVPTNDTWTRDYGPIVTTTGPDDWQINDFRFNGWGSKFDAEKDNLVTGTMCREGAFMGEYRDNLDFVLEGGSIESDGKGTVMTTAKCVLNPNRNPLLSREEVEERLKRAFGATNIIMLENGALEGDDTDSHIDTLARFAPGNVILYVECRDTSDTHFEELERMKRELESARDAEGMPYTLMPLPLPDAVYDEDGLRLPATYANFLVVNDAVFVPVYSQREKDAEALATIGRAFPGREIVPVECSALIKQHGSLHCATMQLPYEILPLCPTPLK